MFKFRKSALLITLLSFLSISSCTIGGDPSNNPSLPNDSSIVNNDPGNTPENNPTTIEPNKYTISWVSDLDVLYRSDEVNEGVTPTYGTNNPTKEATIDTIYTFDHWEPSVVAASRDATYKAVFSSTVRKYTVTWLNDNDDLLKEEQVPYGTIPSYGSDPSKESNAQYLYTFDHWDKPLTEVCEDITYKAVYSSLARQYTVTWVNDDDSVLDSGLVDYGVTPSYTGTPEKDSTAQYIYTFNGWDKTVVPVTGDVTYKATYTPTLRKYDITWLNDNEQVIKVDQVNYGETPSFGIENPVKDSTAQYTYSFSHWDVPPVPVNGNATYRAVYDSLIRSYNVTWLSDDNSVIKVTQCEYGATPSFGVSDPEKASTDEYSYEFDSWDKEIVPVTGDVTYKASFTPIPRQYSVTFKNYDGTTLSSKNYAYGETPSYTSMPSRPSTLYNYYTFDTWSPSIKSVTEDAIYTAKYMPGEIEEYEYSSTPGPETVYFTNNQSWANVYAYAYNTGATANEIASWPGVLMQHYRVNEYNQRVYKLTGVSNYQFIIFSNGETQTKDIDMAYNWHNKHHNAYYTDGWDNNEKKHPVASLYESGLANNGQNILHCFDWSLATVEANLDSIAAQGFTAIQLSPLQPVKDFQESYNDTNATWWRFYQPIGFCLGDSRTNILFSSTDNRAELAQLTTKARRKGIRVIVDIVVNHLADGGDSSHGELSPQIEEFNPEIYNNYTQTLHNPYERVELPKSNPTAAQIVRSDVFGKDLNTSNSLVQTAVLNYLKELVDCGVYGFRFDAAKHVETTCDNDRGCGSDFWTNTLGAVKSYAFDRYGRNVWAYGEILSHDEGGRSIYDYIYYSYFDAALGSPSWYSGLQPNNCVAYTETHDEYMKGNSPLNGQSNVNDFYAQLMDFDKKTNVLYFVRPVTDSPVGVGVGLDAGDGWLNEYVKYVNRRPY